MKFSTTVTALFALVIGAAIANPVPAAEPAVEPVAEPALEARCSKNGNK